MKRATAARLAAATLLLIITGVGALSSARHYDAYDPKKPLLNSTWPAGIQALVNIKERTGGQSINAIQNFTYSGTTAALNTFLKRYAGYGHKSVIFGTTEEAMGAREVGYDWKLQVNGYTDTVSLMMALHGHIRPADVELPAGLDVDSFDPSNPIVQRILKNYKAKPRR